MNRRQKLIQEMLDGVSLHDKTPTTDPKTKKQTIEMKGQLWEECERCGSEPCYLPLHLCERCWPRG